MIGGWEALVSTALTGTCRTVFPWTDTSSVLNIAFGTHSALMVWKGGGLSDITPFGPPVMLGTNPLATTNTSTTVVVTQVAHGYSSGIDVIIYGAAATNGIAAANINGTRGITVLTADTYSFTAGAADTASSTASGGGSAIVITPQTALTAGAVNGTGGAGWGTGSYSVGYYSDPSTSDYFARTWSLSAWGANLIANPRAGGIYTWTNNTATRAIVLDNAPTQCIYALVAPTRQVFAFGCNEESSGVANPLCIRHSSIGNNTEWNTAVSTTAREIILPGGGGLVGGRIMGEYILAWTTSALYLGSYVGSIDQVWKFDRVGDECGLIGPNAAVIVGQHAFWIGPDLQFYTYALGGEPFIVSCPIREDFADNLTASQADKIVASSISAFNEIRFDYPDSRDGTENSRFLLAHVPTLMNNAELAWSRGTMARTAFCDAPPSVAASPIGVSETGTVYWHERGQTADGSAFSWFIKTADTYLDPDTNMQVRQVWPDFRDQVGPVMVSVTTRFAPQGDQTTVSGGTMAPGDRKSDVRATGRLANIRFSGNSSPTACRLGNPTIDVAPAGGR